MDAVLADDREQIHLRQSARVHQGIEAAAAQLDGHAVVVAGLDQLAYLIGAGARDVGRAEHRQLDPIDHQIAPWFHRIGHGFS